VQLYNGRVMGNPSYAIKRIPSTPLRFNARFQRSHTRILTLTLKKLIVIVIEDITTNPSNHIGGVTSNPSDAIEGVTNISPALLEILRYNSSDHIGGVTLNSSDMIGRVSVNIIDLYVHSILLVNSFDDLSE